MQHSSKKVLILFIVALFPLSIFSQKLMDTAIKINKSNISNSMYRLMQLNPINFKYDTKTYPHLNLQEGLHHGFMANEMEKIFPELIHTKRIAYSFGKNLYRDATIKSIDEMELIPILVAGLKEQQLQIEKLQTDIIELKKLIINKTSY